MEVKFQIFGVKSLQRVLLMILSQERYAEKPTHQRQLEKRTYKKVQARQTFKFSGPVHNTLKKFKYSSTKITLEFGFLL